MSTYQTDPRVDSYINSLPDWQQDICRRVRELAHAADPGVVETIKRTNRPYFTLDGNICALLGAKGHVNVFIYDPIAPDPEGIVNQGHGNLTARAIQIHQGDTLNERALLNLLRAVIANNRAGGWRKVQGKQLPRRRAKRILTERPRGPAPCDKRRHFPSILDDHCRSRY